MRIIYVITWRYHDGSASGVVCAHATRPAADQMLEILTQHCDGMKRFVVEPTPYSEE